MSEDNKQMSDDNNNQTSEDGKRPMRTWVKVVSGVVVLAVLAVTAGPFIYINFIKEEAAKSAAEQGLPVRETTDDSSADTPDATTEDTTPATADDTTPEIAAEPTTTAASPATTERATGAESSTSVAAATGPGETYTLTTSDDTFVGYRVVEVLFGQDTEGVGRTNSVTGSLTLDGTQITSAEFTVDVATFVSDEGNRDRKFRGDIMDTDEFPTATFLITEPIELGSIPADGTEITATATGDLTLHGVTNSVTIEVKAQRSGDIIDVLGSTDIVFADYNIDNPSTGGITTQDHGLLEFVLTFTKN